MDSSTYHDPTNVVPANKNTLPLEGVILKKWRNVDSQKLDQITKFYELQIEIC